jgi:hypothetical protein
LVIAGAEQIADRGLAFRERIEIAHRRGIAGALSRVHICLNGRDVVFPSAAETTAVGLAVEQIGFRPRALVGDVAPSLHRWISRFDARQGTLD